MKTNEQGAAAVEAAIVFPLLIMIVFGLAEYAYYYLTYDRYQQAVFAGARAGAICTIEGSEGCPGGKEEVAKNTATQMLKDLGYAEVSIPSITVDPARETTVPGKTMIVVSIETPYTPIVPFMAPFIPDQMIVQSPQLNYVE